MRKARALKYGVFISVIVVASLASVMYALAYTVKRSLVYRNLQDRGARATV